MSATVEVEREFHDQWADQLDPAEVLVRKSFEGVTAPEGRWIRAQLGDLAGKQLLELGSGAGEGAVYFALQGANVTATDLSPGMLKVVDRVAALHGVKVSTKVSTAEDLSAFPDASFDVVYAANLLHHVNIATCVGEVHRVLKPGGLAAFWDPVEYNPAIQAYRKLATAVRTPDEHPMRRADVALIRSRFSEMRSRFFWLTALAVFVRFYLIDHIHPSSDRYWKRILTHESELKALVGPLLALDRAIIAVIPFLKWWCWNVAIVARK